MKRYDIFISCNSKDYPIGEDLRHYLESRGFSVFIASEELNKLGRSDYSAAIDTILDQCRHFILIASNYENLQSKWVTYEWQTYCDDLKDGYRNGEIVTILSDTIELKKLPGSIRHRQKFSLLEDYKPKVEEFFRSVEGSLLDFPRNGCRNLDWLVKRVIEAEKKEIGIISKGKNYFFFDKNSGRIINECIYDRVEKFQGGNSIVWLNGKAGVIDSEINEIIPCDYDEFWPEYGELLINCVRNGKSGTFLWNGQKLIPETFPITDYMSTQLGENLHPICSEESDKGGIYDIQSHKLIIPCDYYYAAPDYYYKLIRLKKKKNSKMGCVDVNNTVIIPFEYDKLGHFYPSGIALAEKDGLFGYIDILANTVIPFMYEEGTLFQGGIAYCKKDDVWYQVDRKGTARATMYDGVWTPQYHEYEFPDSSPVILFFFVSLNGKVGTVDIDGNVMIPCTSKISGTLFPNCVRNDDTDEYLDPMGNPISLELKRRIESHKAFGSDNEPLFSRKK